MLLGVRASKLGLVSSEKHPQISTLQLCETWSNVLACVA